MTSDATEQTFLLPDLGEGLTEAEVVNWLVSVGDTVVIDQPVAEVETAKSIVEVPSPYAGRVATLHAEAGGTVDVGRPLISVSADATEISGTAVTGEPGSPPAAAVREGEAYREEEQGGSGNVLIGYGTSATATGRRRRPRAAAGRPAADTASGSTAAPARGPAATTGGVVKVVSPLVRRFAKDHGVDVRRLTPTGTGGVITRADVQGSIDAAGAAATAPAPAPAAAGAAPVVGERRVPLSGFRKAVAAGLSRSRAEIPEATVWVDVDATALWQLRESARTAADPGPGLLSYLARFSVAALKAYPVLNARLDVERDEIVEYQHINLGIAVQGDRGLVVPAVMGAGSMTTAELDRSIRALAGRAREGRVSPEELAAGTFTLNNYGGFRVDGSAAIINHPQVGILGFGRIIDRPWGVDGEIKLRKITQMSFVFDHRVCDGGTAAGFMRCVADAVENPAGAIAGL